LWILDFLTRRRQRVKTVSETSEYISINTGAPQGCVLSAFLFTMYTNDLCCDNADCKIIKYADDTIAIGLIRNNNVSVHRNTIEYVTEWCNKFYLNLNVKKTKELICDFRKSCTDHNPLVINGDNVDISSTLSTWELYWRKL
jgi:hypothetical protein